ncbi:hypothetical protein EXIGLDRAFT_721116 [Exidia glandulosa HHB12029]|uniref:Cupredoxin n=1 Tax=Exidia glandulosa HHB12029 TaxID=1314781 RepID=A0A165FY43_EXIGL|nr:hypothetical protein EXIGLDRAFT_721116 [Exidia glandulosa HHB12029]
MRLRTLVVAAGAAVLAGAVQHQIVTGRAGDYFFMPRTVNAEPGESVIFAFPPGANHSVIQSRPDAPCTALEGGFRSRHFDLTRSTDQRDRQFFVIQVNNTDPIFFYCAVPGPPAHCTNGMFGVINAANESVVDAYESKVLTLTALPTQPWMDTYTGIDDRPQTDSWKRVWGIVVGVAGGLAVLVCVTCCGCWCCCGKALMRRQAALARIHNLSVVGPGASTAAPVNRHPTAHDDELPAYEERNRDVAVQVPHYDESAPAYDHHQRDRDVEAQAGLDVEMTPVTPRRPPGLPSPLRSEPADVPLPSTPPPTFPEPPTSLATQSRFAGIIPSAPPPT